MRPTTIPLFFLSCAACLAALPARANEVPECVTTTTTTTRCTGAAAPLAAPPAPDATLAPVAPVAPAPAYPAPAPFYAPPATYAPPPFVPQLRSRTELRPRYGLIAAGASIFGASWLLNASIAYMAGEGTLAIPLVGPLLLAHKVSENDRHADAGDRTFTMLMVFDALVQTTGVVLFIAGVATKKQVTVWDKVAIGPSVTPGGAGLAASGRF